MNSGSDRPFLAWTNPATEKELSELRERFRTGGGNGNGGGVDDRVARLERNVDQMAKDVSDTRADVASIKENVRHLPTKPWLFTTLLALLTGLGIVIAAVVRFVPHAP